MLQAALREHFDYSIGSTIRGKALWQGLLRPTRRKKGAKPTHRHCIKDGVFIDPTSGSGSLLINIGRSVAKHISDENNVKYYAQELKENTYNLTRMNLHQRELIKLQNVKKSLLEKMFI